MQEKSQLEETLRRRETRPARRHTLHTSTKVSHTRIFHVCASCLPTYGSLTFSEWLLVLSITCICWLCYLASTQASPSGYWYLQPRHVYSELFCQRHFRARSNWSFQACCIQQEIDYLVQRDSDLVCSHQAGQILARILTLLISRVRLILPGELAKHAVSEGTKAVTKYSSSTK